MRRQASAADIAREGSSRLFRLDPLRLPVRFTANDGTADGGTRAVELSRDAVEVTRAVRGVKMRLRLPIKEFLGISVRVVAIGGEPRIFLLLEHADDALSVVLQSTGDSAEAAANARQWSRVLGCMLLIAGADGRLRNPASMRRERKNAPRRARRTALKERRTTIRFRRTPSGGGKQTPSVHSGEREIIARN